MSKKIKKNKNLNKTTSLIQEKKRRNKTNIHKKKDKKNYGSNSIIIGSL
jgi:hypothetical protein